jgi:hypothetical protein
MTRRLLAMLIALVGTAGVVVVVLSTIFPVEDRVTLVQPGPIRSVEVDLEAGRVTVVPGEGDGATVDRTRRHLWGEPEVSETAVAGVLRIVAECQRIVTFGCGVDYRLEVPTGVTVRIRTGRGSVSVSDIAGMVEVDTGSGSVRLARTKGPVRVNTSAGNVEGVDLAPDFLDATTNAGRIRLSLAEPPGRLGLRTGAGNIDVGLPRVPGGYRVDADAGAGRVDIGVENNEGGSRTVTARTGAGNIGVHVR